jgi:hypothetical protein
MLVAVLPHLPLLTYTTGVQFDATWNNTPFDHEHPIRMRETRQRDDNQVKLDAGET